MCRWKGSQISLDRFRNAPSLLRGVIGEAMSTKQYVLLEDVHDVSKHPKDGYRPFPYEPEVRTELAVPIIRGTKAIGVLNLEHIKPNVFSDNDVLWALLLAGLAAEAVDAEGVISQGGDKIPNPRLSQIVNSNAYQFQTKLNITRPAPAITLLLNAMIEITEYENATVEEIEQEDTIVAYLRLENERITATQAQRRQKRQSIEPINLPPDRWVLEKGNGNALDLAYNSEHVLEPFTYIRDRFAEQIPTSLIREDWICSEFVIPVIVRESTPIGYFYIGMAKANALPPSTDEAIEDLVHSVTFVLDNLHSSESAQHEKRSAQQERDELKLVLKAGSKSISVMNFKAAAGEVVKITEQLFPHNTGVYLYQCLAGRLELESSSHRARLEGRQSLPIDGTIAGRCVTEREAQAVLDVTTDEYFRRDIAESGAEAVTYLGPVNAIFGVIAIYSNDPFMFGDDRIEKLKLLSQVASNTLASMMQPQEPVKLSKRLIDIAMKLTQRALLERQVELLDEILQAAVGLTNFPDTYCSVLRLNADKSRLVLGRHTDKQDDDPLGQPKDMAVSSNSVCGRAILEEHTIYVPDCQAPEWRDIVKKRKPTDHPGSELAVLLKYSEEIIGVINLESPSTDAFKWAQEPIEQLAMLVAQILNTNDQYRELSSSVSYIAHQLSKTPDAIKEGLEDIKQQIAISIPTITLPLDTMINATRFVRLGVQRLSVAVNPSQPDRPNRQHFEQLDIRQLVHETVEGYRYYIEKTRGGSEVRYLRGPQMSSNDEIRVTLVKQDMEAVIAELLDNARKYSNPGTTISVDVLRSGLDAVNIICDSYGRSVPLEKRFEIFKHGYRDNVDETTPGTGQGLAFVASTITSWGGNVSAEDLPPDQYGQFPQGLRIILYLLREPRMNH